MPELGNNVFDEEQELFLRIDTAAEEERLIKEGSQRGKDNHPDSASLELDRIETGVIEKITATVEQTKGVLTQHLGRFEHRLSIIFDLFIPQQIQDRVNLIKDNAEQELQSAFNEFNHAIAIKLEDWQGARREYDTFREDNHIIGPANYLPIWKMIVWFGIIFLIEAVLGGALLWEHMGIANAVSQAILITLVNVMVFAVMVGWALRHLNLISWKRWTGLFAFVGAFFGLIFNLGVGHYRDAVIEARERDQQLQTGGSSIWDSPNIEVAPYIDATKAAMEKMTQSFFGIDSSLSWLLIIVGIGFWGLASYKWYSMLDRYPGYKKLDMARKDRHKDYTKLICTTAEQMKNIKDDAIEKIVDERTKATNIHYEYNDKVNRAQNLQAQYENWISALDKKQTHLLTSYRDSNQQVRTTPPPKHFNERISINEALSKPPEFTPPLLEDENIIKTVLNIVRTSEEDIRKLYNDNQRRFEQACQQE